MLGFIISFLNSFPDKDNDSNPLTPVLLALIIGGAIVYLLMKRKGTK